MTRRSLISIAAAVALSVGAVRSAEEPGSDNVGAKGERQKLSEEELLDIYYAFVEKAKPYGLPTDRAAHQKAVAPEVMGWVEEDDLLGSEYTVTVGSGKLVLNIDGYSGEVLWYRLEYLFDAVSGVRGEYAPRRVPPKLKGEEVIEKVKPYLAWNRRMRFDNYAPSAEYEGNHWYVAFKRRLGKYEYQRDRIVVCYSEKYGLLSYRSSLFSDECDIEAKITSEQGGELAAKYIVAFAKKEGYRGTFSSVGDGWFAIINPVTYEGALEEREPVTPIAKLRKTRLVWWESFKNRTAGVRIIICVDAITSELLCYEVISK